MISGRLKRRWVELARAHDMRTAEYTKSGDREQEAFHRGCAAAYRNASADLSMAEEADDAAADARQNSDWPCSRSRGGWRSRAHP